MRPAAQFPPLLRVLSRAIATPSPSPSPSPSVALHATARKAAHVAPALGTGPPPEPPIATVRNVKERIERRQRQAEMLKQAKVVRNAKDGKTTTLRKRFWKEVTVKEVDGKAYIHNHGPKRKPPVYWERFYFYFFNEEPRPLEQKKKKKKRLTGHVLMKRSLPSLPRHPTPSPPADQENHSSAALQAQSRLCHRPGMGLPHVHIPGNQAASHTPHQPRLPGP